MLLPMLTWQGRSSHSCVLPCCSAGTATVGAVLTSIGVCAQCHVLLSSSVRNLERATAPAAPPLLFLAPCPVPPCCCCCFHHHAAKKSVNVGKSGGTAGLDDYIYDAPEEDEFDFM
jgi:hypothetical protein